MKNYFNVFFLLAMMSFQASCSEDEGTQPKEEEKVEEPTLLDKFYFGADLSYVNQILDQGGTFQVEGVTQDPYQIFADKGTNLVRLRLWHNPVWTKEIYGEEATATYNDVADVERAIAAAKAQGMEVLLDFHYSDDWADPAKQFIPAAWQEITEIAVLGDSVYNYTYKVLNQLNEKGLMPEFVQLGNETNCGMMYSEAPEAFPDCNVCNGDWSNMRTVLNRGISAVNDVEANSEVDTKVILHVADPKNIDWWFSNVGISGYDIIGFSYYPLWHTTISMEQLEATVRGFKEDFGKEVMILETAYPWTTDGNDNYNNLFGGNDPIAGYPYTPDGQLALLKAMTQSVINGGGMGIIYWEPAWISSDMKDQWGTGSSWENNAFFDFDGNANQAFEYMSVEYQGLE
ncbi:glycoside hydrolase family 53 protein [Reichenbachiella ulvae]|uniref:Arabinogalactan endo-beta-1,4-galactanase n=1 Tax=Reichenbachiella ulvae TaxID=2980104 RepID=A0ABT3CTV1_9BACT|nr:arabinogalactan endo-1,4-beta-galactosidase [Reichenbachiella ulvae]MCV9387022.1 arabinogalactan endo-1,4-beta-galactosidase [Reichenbachiella ulvae]